MLAALELLRHYGIPGFEDEGLLIRFLKKYWNFWKLHDILNITQHFMKRIENKKPFYCKEDEQLPQLAVRKIFTMVGWLEIKHKQQNRIFYQWCSKIYQSINCILREVPTWSRHPVRYYKKYVDWWAEKIHGLIRHQLWTEWPPRRSCCVCSCRKNS